MDSLVRHWQSRIRAARAVTLMALGIKADMPLTAGQPGRTSAQAFTFLIEAGEVL